MIRYSVWIALLMGYYGYSQNNCSVAGVKSFQTTINTEYATRGESPLKEKDFKEFKTLDFFPIDLKYCIIAKFIRTEKEKPFEMPTSSGKQKRFVKYGEAQFTINGKTLKLNIYKSLDLTKLKKYKDNLFLPFTDLTSGVTTYGGGRYIDLLTTDIVGETITIDFNKAYNPYCAYSENYSCPIPPEANDLKIEIRAGVKKFHD